MSLSDACMVTSKPANVMTLAERLQAALALEERSQNAVERQAGLKTGQLSNYATGKRGGSTIAVDKLRALADVLHVTFDWLAFGEGPMRKGGRETTPAEEAMLFARRAGIREDAWQVAWVRYQDRAEEMTAVDWVVAIQTEAQLLARAGAQEPKLLGPAIPPEGVDERRKALPPSRTPRGR